MSLDNQHRDEVSRRMGQLLLKSYALLDEYCQECQSPLMRDPKNNLMCVSCQILSAKKPKRETIDSSVKSNPAAPARQLDSTDFQWMDSQLDDCQRLLMGTLTHSCRMLDACLNGVEKERLLKDISSILDILQKIRHLKSQ